MNTSEPFRSLDIDSTAADPSLAGHHLARLRRQQNINPGQQAAALGIDMERSDNPLLLPDAKGSDGSGDDRRPDGLGGGEASGVAGRAR